MEKTVKRPMSDAARIGLALLFSQIMTYFISCICAILFHGKLETAMDYAVVLLVSYALSFAVELPLMGKILHIPWRSVWTGGKTDWRGMGRYVPVCFLSAFLGATLGLGLMGLLQSVGLSSTNSTLNELLGADTPLPIVLSILAVVFIGPLFEEFFTRGLLLTALKPYGGVFAIVVSALFFTVLHGNLEQSFTPFILGLIWGYITLKTGSVKTAYMLHALNNAMPYIGAGIGALFSMEEFPFAYLVLGVVGIFGVVVLVRHRKDLRTNLTAWRGGEEIAPHPARRFFLNPLILLYCAYWLYLLIASLQPIA